MRLNRCRVFPISALKIAKVEYFVKSICVILWQSDKGKVDFTKLILFLQITKGFFRLTYKFSRYSNYMCVWIILTIFFFLCFSESDRILMRKCGSWLWYDDQIRRVIQVWWLWSQDTGMKKNQNIKGQLSIDHHLAHFVGLGIAMTLLLPKNLASKLKHWSTMHIKNLSKEKRGANRWGQHLVSFSSTK